jgi:tetratricopeptide (TPR) repeat protein
MRPVAAALLGAGLMTLFMGPCAALPSAGELSVACASTVDEKSADAQIAACTSAIESGKWSGKGLSWAYANRVGARVLKGDLEGALADANEAVRLDPQNTMAFNNRGFVYSFMDDPERALADFNQSIRLDPSQPLPYLNRGQIYAERNEFDRAVAEFSEAIRLDPKFITAHTNRARTFFAKHDYDRAIQDLSEAIKLGGNTAEIFSDRGLNYLAARKPDPAIADFEEAVRIDPQYIPAIHSLGDAYLAKGDYGRAVPYYDKAIGIDGKDARHYFNRGRARLYQGAFSDAAADFNRASELEPQVAYLLLWREIASKRGGLPSLLGAEGPKVDMTAWPAPIVRLYLGEVAPDAVEAAADKLEAGRRKSGRCEAKFYLGELRLFNGQRVEAKGLLETVTRECPEFPSLLLDAAAELRALGAAP